jgi:hypothetical protein
MCVCACKHILQFDIDLFWINLQLLGILIYTFLKLFTDMLPRYHNLTFNSLVSDFNKEYMSSLKMTWKWIETCWGVLCVFNAIILD